MFQEGFAPCRSNAGDGIQLRRHAKLLSFLAVGSNAITMCLIADALYQI